LSQFFPIDSLELINKSVSVVQLNNFVETVIYFDLCFLCLLV